MFQNKSFPKDLLTIVRTIKKAGYKCYVVGGGVRDLLLKKTPGTWDLTTNARPETITKLFKKVVPTGIKYGTVTILINKVPYEVTTFRSDEKYVDGRHPLNVRFSNDLKTDLSRRDFTVNALAYDPTTGELIDEFNGLKDIKKKLIRAVGDPVERFREDGLRPLRACRFAAKLSFKIEPKTFGAISKCLKTSKKVSMERVHDEIMRIMYAGKPSVGIDLMRRSGLLSIYVPELLEGVNVKQPKNFHKYDVYWHSLYSCDNAPKERPLLRFIALLHDVSKPECKDGMTFYGHENEGAKTVEKIMKRLKFSNDNIRYAVNLVKHHMFNYSDDWGDPAVRRFMQRVGTEDINDLFMLRTADIKAMGRKNPVYTEKKLRSRIDKALKEQNAIRLKDLKVNGNDVMKLLKVPPGPKIGVVLEKLLDKVIENPGLNKRERLLEMVRKLG